ncbi:ABC transport system permease protein [Thermotomaculum hydrothermale]|uniref:ABC transport system permease protein n=1 Tax=Thermotomaculum hydrothermale TaxID=981385 RepID=A0A7R6PPP6_9BACT|nr:iron export ABC transporter permease subunit FetB [Thermotomaculum hydrothermale]BBB33006.1 ABC transport system permease protein [Thermotomaculum hydrothermale]
MYEKVIYSAVLLILAIAVSYFNRLKAEKDLIVGGIRAAIQLVIIGYILHYIFDLNKLWAQLLLLFVMSLIAAHTAKGRAKEVKNAGLFSFIGIVCGTTVSIGLLLAVGFIKPEPKFLIPLGGMVIGNTMTASALALDRFHSELKSNLPKILFALSLGMSTSDASVFYVRKSIKAAMTPIINTLKIVGIIQLPGAMTGMLIAGASPMKAAMFQLVIMYMIASAVSIGSSVALLIARKKLFYKDITVNI